MLDIRRKDEHYHHSESWLETDWHFSFGQYQDPDNVRFGPLRVLNYDRVQGGKGWGMHSHQDMEIITWVIEGEIVHEDSTGTKKRIGRNGLQKMSAGNGISHSEYNGLENKELKLVQIWIEPDKSGIEPNYEDATFEQRKLMNGWRLVASGQDKAPVSIERNAEVYVAHLESKVSLTYDLIPDSKYYLVNLEGQALLNGKNFCERDAALIRDLDELEVQAEERAELLLLQFGNQMREN